MGRLNNIGDGGRESGERERFSGNIKTSFSFFSRPIKNGTRESVTGEEPGKDKRPEQTTGRQIDHFSLLCVCVLAWARDAACRIGANEVSCRCLGTTNDKRRRAQRGEEKHKSNAK